MEPEIDKMFNILKEIFMNSLLKSQYHLPFKDEIPKQFIDNLDIEDSEQYRERINKHIVLIGKKN